MFFFRNTSESLGFEPLLINQTHEDNEPISDPSSTGDYKKSSLGTETAKINIMGMTCQSCVNNIQGLIGQKPGVFNITVNLPDKSALVTYNPATTNPQEICDWIDDMGFEASLPLLGHKSEPDECLVHIDGMTCQSCVQTIEGDFYSSVSVWDFRVLVILGMLSTSPGVVSIKVNLENREAYVRYLPDQLRPKEIASQIEDMGFEAYVKSVNGREVKKGVN